MKLLSDDWGFYYTLTANLKKVMEFATSNQSLAENDKQLVNGRLSGFWRSYNPRARASSGRCEQELEQRRSGTTKLKTWRIGSRENRTLSDITRIFFATDLHGSEKCFLKFVNAGKFYKTNILIMGGDITGKLMIPIVEQTDGSFEAKYADAKQTARSHR